MTGHAVWARGVHHDAFDILAIMPLYSSTPRPWIAVRRITPCGTMREGWLSLADMHALARPSGAQAAWSRPRVARSTLHGAIAQHFYD